MIRRASTARTESPQSRFGRQVVVGHNAVASIMRELGIKGLPNRRLPHSARVGRVGGPDLVRRQFHRQAPDDLWMTDITEHPTRKGKIYCCVVLDAFSRRAGRLVDRLDPDHGAGHQCPRDGHTPAILRVGVQDLFQVPPAVNQEPVEAVAAY